MPSEPLRVLPYRSVDPARARRAWVWASVAAVLLAMAVGFGFFLGRRPRAVVLTPVQTTVALPPSPTVTLPATKPPPVPKPFGTGGVKLSGNAVYVPYGRFFLLKDKQAFVAVRITAADGGKAIDYEWASARGGRDFSASGASRGTGRTSEQDGWGRIIAGHFGLPWSMGGPNGGWVYWPPSHPGLAISSEVTDELPTIPTTLPAEQWHDRNGPVP